MPSSALAIAISRALMRPSRSRRARRRSSSEPMSLQIAKAGIVGSPPQTTTSATRDTISMQLPWRVSVNSGRYEAAVRDFSALTISYKAPLYDTGIPSPGGSRRPFSGAPEDIAGDIRTFAAIGVHELIFDFRGRSIRDSIERLQSFAAEVIPLPAV